MQSFAMSIVVKKSKKCQHMFDSAIKSREVCVVYFQYETIYSEGCEMFTRKKRHNCDVNILKSKIVKLNEKLTLL